MASIFYVYTTDKTSITLPASFFVSLTHYGKCGCRPSCQKPSQITSQGRRITRCVKERNSCHSCWVMLPIAWSKQQAVMWPVMTSHCYIKAAIILISFHINATLTTIVNLNIYFFPGLFFSFHLISTHLWWFGVLRLRFYIGLLIDWLIDFITITNIETMLRDLGVHNAKEPAHTDYET